MTTSRYYRWRTWRKMENDRIGREELLVAGDDEGGGEVCRRVRPVPKAQKLSKSSGRQTNAQLHTREAMEAH